MLLNFIFLIIGFLAGSSITLSLAAILNGIDGHEPEEEDGL